MALGSEFRVVMSVTISAWKRCSVREDWCLIYVVCVCLRIVVSNTYCVVFVLFFFVLCTIPCVVQFLWIVHFWSCLWYSLTFTLYLLINYKVSRMESKITEEGIHVDTSIEAFADIKRQLDMLYDDSSKVIGEVEHANQLGEKVNLLATVMARQFEDLRLRLNVHVDQKRENILQETGKLFHTYIIVTYVWGICRLPQIQ